MTHSRVLGYAELFDIEGNVLSIRPYGSGHINDTYLVTTGTWRYVLQRLNTSIFTRPEELMENLRLVTEHLRERIFADGGDLLRETLTLIPTKDGRLWVSDDTGFWRMTLHIDGSFALDRAESPEDVIECGRGFGRFMTRLADFPADTLAETIPNFHNTPMRLEALKASAEADTMGRLGSCRELCEKYISRIESYSAEWRRLDAVLPKRVTHNDTKINNILFDSDSRKALAVIDLDTVMPGLSVFDFGDAIRTGAATADEDTPHPETMGVSAELFAAYARGYLEKAKGLTDDEIDALVLGAKMMTYECGSRFLADYLSGDVYYKVSRPNHNLDRAASQMALLEDMERKTEELERIIRELR